MQSGRNGSLGVFHLSRVKHLMQDSGGGSTAALACAPRRQLWPAPPTAVPAFPNAVSNAEIAPAIRSSLTVSGKGIVKAGPPVRASRVNSPDSV